MGMHRQEGCCTWAAVSIQSLFRAGQTEIKLALLKRFEEDKGIEFHPSGRFLHHARRQFSMRVGESTATEEGGKSQGSEKKGCHGVVSHSSINWGCPWLASSVGCIKGPVAAQRPPVHVCTSVALFPPLPPPPRTPHSGEGTQGGWRWPYNPFSPMPV